jgi:hypothetical protein
MGIFLHVSRFKYFSCFLRVFTVANCDFDTDNRVTYTHLKTIMKTYTVKLKQVAVMTGMALSGIGVSGAITPANALTFNFISAAGTSQQAINGFNAAGSLWTSSFNDNVTVNINIGFSALGANILGQANSNTQFFTYNQVSSALNADKKSADDNLAVSNLSKISTSSAFNLLLNRTANNPNGSGSATPYLDNNGDANNSSINMNTANAKALGLIAGNRTTSDANISFSTLFSWDFDRSDGITAGTFDFVGIAAHEIGHALGFVSGVDILDYYGGTQYNDNLFTYVAPLDLFRYSTESKNLGAIDWTADTRDKYFSLDGGTTKIASFSTGVRFGDGQQASHWKDNLGLGILDPTASRGEKLAIAENDLRALDVIGWNRGATTRGLVKTRNPISTLGSNPTISGLTASATATDVPEPENFVGTFIFAAFGIKMVLKRRQKRSNSSDL